MYYWASNYLNIYEKNSIIHHINNLLYSFIYELS